MEHLEGVKERGVLPAASLPTQNSEPSLGAWTDSGSRSFEQLLSLTVMQSGFLCECVCVSLPLYGSVVG